VSEYVSEKVWLGWRKSTLTDLEEVIEVLVAQEDLEEPTLSQSGKKSVESYSIPKMVGERSLWVNPLVDRSYKFCMEYLEELTLEEKLKMEN
jgi:hypothetical protein